MGGYLFGHHHQGIIQNMWLEVFDACITTNSYLTELWPNITENVEENTNSVTRQKQIEMALQYFDEKCQPLRQIIEKVGVCELNNREEEEEEEEEEVLLFGSCGDTEHKLLGDSFFSGEDETRNNQVTSDSSPLSYLHLDLSSTCINDSNNHLVLCSDEERKPNPSLMSYRSHALTVTPDPVPPVTSRMTMTNQEKTLVTNTSTNSNPLTEIGICDKKDDVWLVDRFDDIGNGTNHSPTPTDDVEEMKSSFQSSSIASNNNYYNNSNNNNNNNNEHVVQRNKKKSESPLQKPQNPRRCLNNTENNNSVFKNPNEKNNNKASPKILPPEPQQEPLLKISLENLRVYLCEKPSSSYDVIHSCLNNFEKLKFLRVKERESPSVRISCAFQQGYYLETLFPGRKIHNKSGKNNYAQHLQELNMSHSYSRQLRQFYKSFRCYRRFLHLYVPLRTILRNITRIREKIDLSEEEKHFWSQLPTNNLRDFYECYSHWFGLNLCDVYTVFDVIDNFPSGTVDQFLESKCVQIFQCEGYVKALNWLQSVANRHKYLLVYKTANHHSHSILVKRDLNGWSYEKSFDSEKHNIIFVGFYIFIKHH